MNAFMDKNFKIDCITNITYVMPDRSARIHVNRPSYGLAFNVSNEKHYIFSDRKKRLDLGPNEIVFLPKGSSYVVDAHTLGDSFAINFQLEDDADICPFTHKCKNSTEFLRLFRKSEMLWRTKDTAYIMRSISILYEIIAKMQIEYNNEYVQSSYFKMIMPAIEYIHQNYTSESINISKLSEMCGISGVYFRKIFKKKFGTSPVKYINNLKLSYAEELIRSKVYTISEAAELSGYIDDSHFSHEFKNHYGVSPRDYKNNN